MHDINERSVGKRSAGGTYGRHVMGWSMHESQQFVLRIAAQEVLVYCQTVRARAYRE